MANGLAVVAKIRADASGGIPWMTIVDGTGKQLITSDGPNGNIGCPVSDEEQAYFVTMLEQTVQRSSAERIQKIASALGDYAKTLR